MRLPFRYGCFILIMMLTACTLENPPAFVTVSDVPESSPDGSLKLTDTVAEWNGEPIAYGELAWMMDRLRSGVVQSFQEQYGVEYADGFWTNEFGGREIPENILKHKALQELAVYKAEQELAKRYGVIKDGGYAVLYEAFIQENQTREAALERNEPIHGPVQYTEFNYFEYIRHNMNLQTEAAFTRNLEVPDEQTLKAFYDKVKFSEFQQPDKIVVRIWRYALPSHATVQDASKVDLIIRELKGEGTGKEILSVAGPALTQSERTFDETTYREDVRYHSALYAIVQELSEGEISQPIASDRETTFIQCLERKAGDVPSYEEARNILKKRYTDGLFKSEVDSKVQRGVLRIDETNFARIRVN